MSQDGPADRASRRPQLRTCPCCRDGRLEEYRGLLGADYDPHGGRAAIRREADFHAWVALGRDPAQFAGYTTRGGPSPADQAYAMTDAELRAAAAGPQSREENRAKTRSRDHGPVRPSPGQAGNTTGEDGPVL